MKKGFTLVELLVVIALLAILTVAVVIILNPAELLKQARDATRISDLASVNQAMALYLADVPTPGIAGADNAPCSSRSGWITTATTSPFLAGMTPTVAAGTAVDGTGWVKVDLLNITSGSPLSRLPIDPINSGNYFYAYACGNGNPLSAEIDANMESAKYSSGTTNVETDAKDGGNNEYIYETGNNLFQ